MSSARSNLVLDLVAGIQQKQAEMDAQQVQQAAGGAAPADPAAGGPPVPGAPMDPAMAAMGGAPMDPAAMAAMGGMPPGPPPSIDDLVKMGDPLAAILVQLDRKLDVVVEAMAKFMDSSGMQVPAGEALTIEAQSAADSVAAPKAASSPLVDNDMDFEDEVSDTDTGIPVTEPEFAQQPKVAGALNFSPSGLALGIAAMPGEGAGQRLMTGFADSDPRNRELASIWRRSR